MNWWNDLCEYYNISKEEAVSLGIRKTGRRPYFPSSKTCKSVGGKNMEEWWGDVERQTVQQKMDFYKDIGAWLTFRQCNYRSQFNYRKYFGSYVKDGCSLVEYGCGVAPLTNYLIENKSILGIDPSTINFCLVDVVSEPLEFAEWRLRKKFNKIKLEIHRITEDYILPNFKNHFNVICIMDVFEHLPNPYNVVRNIISHSCPKCIMVETWVDKSDGKLGGPDLEEAEMERLKTVNLLDDTFKVVSGGSIRTRVKNE